MFSLTMLMVSPPTLIPLSVLWRDAADPLQDLQITLAALTQSLTLTDFYVFLCAVCGQHTFRMTVAM